MINYPIVYKEKLLQEIEATPEEYLPTLLNIVRSYRQSVSLNPADESFRQGWQEALAGETMPLDDLWAGIDAQ
ncbi:MAG: hypothetical protein IPM39_14450 [Chloroflexi bacterium]|jgi:hypothetical protein|nr:hypothetical protein [Chloroflexota bacterium]